MNPKNIHEIAELEDLTVIETTTGANGCPQELQHALIGFNDWAHLDAVREKYNLEPFEAFKRDGCSLWNRSNVGRVYGPFTITADSYGDDYAEFVASDEFDFFKNEVAPMLEPGGFDSFEDIEEFLEEKREILAAIELAGDSVVVITRDGRYFETVLRNPMQWSFDTKNYAIGLI